MSAKDAPRPDIGTADVFRQTMLEAKSVGHSKEGLSGVHFLAALDRLGIVAEMKPKLRPYEGAGLTQAIASGEAEMGDESQPPNPRRCGGSLRDRCNDRSPTRSTE